MPRTEYIMGVDVAGNARDFSAVMVVKVIPRGQLPNTYKVVGSELIPPCNTRAEFEAELQKIKDKYESLYPNIKLIES